MCTLHFYSDLPFYEFSVYMCMFILLSLVPIQNCLWITSISWTCNHEVFSMLWWLWKGNVIIELIFFSYFFIIAMFIFPVIAWLWWVFPRAALYHLWQSFVITFMNLLRLTLTTSSHVLVIICFYMAHLAINQTTIL